MSPCPSSECLGNAHVWLGPFGVNAQAQPMSPRTTASMKIVGKTVDMLAVGDGSGSGLEEADAARDWRRTTADCCLRQPRLQRAFRRNDGTGLSLRSLFQTPTSRIQGRVLRPLVKGRQTATSSARRRAAFM